MYVHVHEWKKKIFNSKLDGGSQIFALSDLLA